MIINKKKFEKSLQLIGRDPDAFSDKFYDKLLKENEELKRVFRNTDLKLQKLEFIKGIIVIFSLFGEEDGPDAFLHDLGIRHVCYEVLPRHYPIIAKALLEAVRETHGDTWNEKIESDWKELVDFISNKMLEGSSKVSAA